MSAADYARTINGRMIALGALAGVVVLCVVIAVVRVLLTSASTGAATATVLVGTHATTPGPLIGAAIGSTALRGHLEFGTPVVLCVDEGLDRPPTTEDTLVLTRTSSIQTYTLHPVSSVHDVDLLVAACRSRPAQPLHAAQLRESRAAQVLTPSVVQSVTVAGPDTDPDHIAPDQMIVTIEVADESLREAFLILADGTRWPVTEQTGTTLHYRVPLTPSRQDAALEHAAPMGPPRVVPIALAAPTSRRALLQEHLTIEEVTARRTTDGLSVTATVLLSGDAPLTLLVNDVTLTTDSGVELPVTWSPPTLEVQHPTSITVQAAYVPEAPLTLVVGGQQFTMSP